MKTTAVHVERVNLGISNPADLKFIKELAARMGWSFEHEKHPGLDDAIADFKSGHTHRAKDVDSLMAQLLD